MRGKLIVLEGGDSSGKSTQFRALKERLEKENISFYTTKFPRHDHPSAYFVDKMLRGEYGSLEEQNPYRTSLFYALDRFDAMPEINDALHDGKLVILDRYTSANIGHQGSKIQDAAKRSAYIQWLEDLEYNICGIPKPDKVYYLHMPTEKALELLEKRNTASAAPKEVDIHEQDASHLYKTEEAYLEAVRLFTNWEIIECAEHNRIRSIEEIHEDLYIRVQKDFLI
ncbi:MAG: dTMP kinase [Candidatus Gracilibacteria bacterium]